MRALEAWAMRDGEAGDLVALALGMGWGGGLLSLHGDHDERLVACTGLHLEGPQLHVGLHDGILEFAANQALGIEHLSTLQAKATLQTMQSQTFRQHNPEKARLVQAMGGVLRVARDLPT